MHSLTAPDAVAETHVVRDTVCVEDCEVLPVMLRDALTEPVPVSEPSVGDALAGPDSVGGAVAVPLRQPDDVADAQASVVKEAAFDGEAAPDALLPPPVALAVIDADGHPLAERDAPTLREGDVDELPDGEPEPLREAAGDADGERVLAPLALTAPEDADASAEPLPLRQPLELTDAQPDVE